MRYISNLYSKSYDIIDYAQSALPILNHKIPGAICSLSNNLARGVGYGLDKSFSLLNMSSWSVSRMTNMQVMGALGNILGASQLIKIPFLLYKNNIISASISGLHGTSHIISLLDSYSGIIRKNISNTMKNRILIDSIYIISSSVASVQVISESIEQIFTVLCEEGSLSVSSSIYLMAEAMIATFGVIKLSNSYYAIIKIRNGIHKLNKLNIDKKQKEFIILYKSITSINKKKNFNAICLNSIEMENDIRMPTNPFVLELYKNCNMMSFVVDSKDKFFESIRLSGEHFKNKIDFLCIIGHANNKSLDLGSHFSFAARENEVDAINKVLSEQAEIILLGCNSATPCSNGRPSLTKKLSKMLPGKYVVGFCAYYSSFLSVTHFSKKNKFFEHNAYFNLSHDGFKKIKKNPFFSSSVIYKEPNLIDAYQSVS